MWLLANDSLSGSLLRLLERCFKSGVEGRPVAGWVAHASLLGVDADPFSAWIPFLANVNLQVASDTSVSVECGLEL